MLFYHIVLRLSIVVFKIQPADGWFDPKKTVIQLAALVILTLMQRWTRVRSRSVSRIGHGRSLWRIFFGQIAG